MGIGQHIGGLWRVPRSGGARVVVFPDMFPAGGLAVNARTRKTPQAFPLCAPMKKPVRCITLTGFVSAREVGNRIPL